MFVPFKIGRKVGLSLLLVCVLSLGLARPAVAQSTDAQEILMQVNALRAANGLAPYTIDASLMASAQDHSNYQASIRQWTHTHRDGTTAAQARISENVAVGAIGSTSAAFIVLDMWSDEIHLRPMIGYASGSMGAGVASDGSRKYYTLHIRVLSPLPTSASSVKLTPGTKIPVTPLPTYPPFAPLLTSTPRADGSVVHVVGFGQTLWAIAQAYGLNTPALRQLNGMAEDSNAVYENQMLLVRRAGSMTPNPAAAATTTVTAPATAAATVSPTAGSAPGASAAAGSATPNGQVMITITPAPTTPAADTPTPPIKNTPSAAALAASPAASTGKPLSPLAAGGIGLVAGMIVMMLIQSFLERKQSSHH